MNLVAWTIVACEIGFWVFIIGGLIARYLFRLEKVGLIILAMTPVIDLVLIIVTGIDMYRGATPTIAHSIAPAYLALSVIFGKDMIRWADERFVYYIKRQGEKPERKIGMAYAKHSMKGSLKHVLAYIFGGAILLLMIFYIGNDVKAEELWATLKIWGIIVGLDVAISMSYFIWPRKK